jgi:pyruvate,water dikinase
MESQPHPEVAAELVRMGIDSIRVNPDTVVRPTLTLLEIEQKLAAQERRDVA